MVGTSLFNKKLILVTGKGGIGKSMVSAALACQAAQHGLKTCIVESSALDQQAPLFGFDPVGHQTTLVRNNISVINLNAQDNFRDFIVLHLGFARLFEKVFTKPIVRSFIQMLPGISELTLLGRLYFMCIEKAEYDLVIFDGFASGHFLSLLKTPDAVLNSGMLGPVIEETKKVKRFIFDEQLVSTVLVTMPEELIVSEAIDFSQRLYQEVRIKISQILVNKCLSPLQQKIPDEVESQGAMGSLLSHLRHRLLVEQASLQKLSEGLKGIYTPPALQPETFLLPDLGSIQEPLSDEFATEWFSRMIRMDP